MDKFVVTGGLSVGKTTVLKLLEGLGYTVVPEVSNELINEYQKVNGINNYPWDGGKRDSFQREVLKAQLEVESTLDKLDGIAFLDRGIPDGVPFYMLDGKEVPQELWETAKTNRYNGVFFMDALPTELYYNDTHRPQSRELSATIEKMLLDIYNELGYSPILVPVLKPRDRANFILQSLGLI